jgi:hypothetical protein
MSMRALMGMVQALTTPGNFMARSIPATSSSVLIRSGQMRRQGAWSHPGSSEYQRRFIRHWSCGLRTMVISIMEKGAGSVEVSARPALPKTRSTSGKTRRVRSIDPSSCWASVTESPGIVVGM